MVNLAKTLNIDQKSTKLNSNVLLKFGKLSLPMVNLPKDLKTEKNLLNSIPISC